MFGFMTGSKNGGWKWGLSSTARLDWTERPLSATVLVSGLANVPQLFLTFCFMALNSFCTAITVVQEWNSLGATRKGLRVSEPRGDQRSTYFLNLPYRWAVPLLVVNTALHWFLSQVFFLVRTDHVDSYGDVNHDLSRTSVGASGVSFAVFFIVFFVLWISVRTLASRKLTIDLPPASSSSLLISAACHPLDGDREAHLKPVQWGAIPGQVVEGYGHCSVSAGPVANPEVGGKYY